MVANKIDKASNKEDQVGLEISISGAIDTVFLNAELDDIRFQNEDSIKNSQVNGKESLEELNNQFDKQENQHNEDL